MSLYESTYIIRHDMSTQQVEQMAQAFTDIVKNNGGEVTKTEHWGLKTLAYRIKKNRKGHYVFFNIDAPSEAMQELERNMRLSEDVLRYLTVRVDELDPEPSPMMQARVSRDERSRRVGRPRDEAESETRKSDAEKSDAEKPGAEKPDAEKPDAEKPDAEKSDAEKPDADGSDAGKATEESAGESPAADNAQPDDPKDDESGDQT